MAPPQLSSSLLQELPEVSYPLVHQEGHGGAGRE